MTTIDPKRPHAAGRPILLDGGMGQELIKRAGRETAKWSAGFLSDAPELVRAVHDDFFAAGADVAIANSYGVNQRRYAEASDRIALNQRAGRLALEARDAHGLGLVAGSLPPYGGSYMPEAVAAQDILARLYEEQATALAPFVDFFICETMSTAAEGRAAAAAAAATGKPVWMGWTVADDDGTRLRSGEPLAEAAAALDGLDVSAFLVNCSAPEAVTTAMPLLAGFGPCGGFANGFRRIPTGWALSGRTTDALGRREDLTPEAYVAAAQAWLDAGAVVIGGCCEVGPAHIAALADAFIRRPKAA